MSDPDQKPLNQPRPNQKKLPLAKLFVAGLSLTALIIFGKHFLGEEAANNLQPGGASDVLGTETPANQIQATPVATQNPAATSGPSNAVTNNPAPAEAPAKNKIKITNTPTGYLNVRSRPSVDSPVIGKVYPGQTHDYSDSEDGWYKVQLSNGQTGWVDGEYTTGDDE